MKTPRPSRVLIRRSLALAMVGLAGLGAVPDADARIKPRVAMFASVAKAAETETPPTDGLRPTERAFVRDASEMSRHEMAAAKLGVSQGASSDVRTFAQQMVTDHSQIIESLNALARKKSVVLLEPTGTTVENYSRLATRSGKDFDKEFVKAMDEAAEESIKIFELAINDAKDTDIRELAGKSLPTLRDHLNKVRELKKMFE